MNSFQGIKSVKILVLCIYKGANVGVRRSFTFVVLLFLICNQKKTKLYIGGVKLQTESEEREI